VDIPGENVTVIEPRFVPGLADEKSEAVRDPMGTRPLRGIVKCGDRLAAVIADLTRPLPSDRLLPWLFEELAHLPADRITTVNGPARAGSTRPRNWPPSSAPRCCAGAAWSTTRRTASRRCCRWERSADGETVYLDRAYVEADRRIVLGFVEPHFMAGFSGGDKGIFSALANIASIMRYHDARTIGDPCSTWGPLEGNPTQAIIRHKGSLQPLDFCVNLTLNRRREITRFFCGHPIAAHEEGCRSSRQTARSPARGRSRSWSLSPAAASRSAPPAS
jgi:nickel-dependent lactate racemase